MPDIKASAQVTIIDITDPYTVVLSSEAHTLAGGTAYANAGSCSTQVTALLGNDPVLVTVGEVTCPPGITATVAANGTASPTVTFSVAAGKVSASCEATIPLTVDGRAEFTKKFSFAVALKGAAGTSVTVSSTKVEYAAGASGTAAPTSGWAASVPSVPAGQYLWTKTTVAYSDGKKTESFSVSRNGSNGSNGTSVAVSSTKVEYQASSSGTTAPTGSWSTSVPSVSAGQYLWTKTTVAYSDGKKTEAYGVSRNGTNGSNGADALKIDISASNGTAFRNSSGSTVLTAHVYKGAAEQSVTDAGACGSLGSVKWYKAGAAAAVATAKSITVTAASVDGVAAYTCNLEG